MSESVKGKKGKKKRKKEDIATPRNIYYSAFVRAFPKSQSIVLPLLTLPWLHQLPSVSLFSSLYSNLWINFTTYAPNCIPSAVISYTLGTIS